uniref:non-specific serine/threonine protein kinase n=1 Tax=Oryza barthii TaxID=65489 RepID=A0A0D3EYV7_9ORYZ
MRHAALLGVGFALCLLRAQAQPYDYPTAKPSTTWANTDAALRHHVAYTDGSVARAALLRLNPARLGPSFAFGFFCTNHRAGAPCADFLLGVAVVYCNSGAGITAVTTGIPQVVWSANRAAPVGDGATAELTADGDLVLRSPGGKVLWSAGAAGRGVSGMSINSDGNLVLFDGSNRTVWQSFDHPTDTLVVGQSLKQGARLTANASFDNSSEGRIYLAVADDGLAAYVDAKPPQRYYVLGYSKNAGAYAAYTNGSLAVLDRPGGQQLATVQLPAVAAGTAAGDVLHPYPGDCAYPTVCGAYGVCTDMQCSCPDAANFRAVDFRRPNRGCVPTSPPAPPATCRSRRARHRLVSLRDTAYFNSHDTSMRTLERVGEAACKAACLGDCACMAAQFVYGFDPNDGFCYLQSEVLSLETMQPEVFHYNSSMHIKIAQGSHPVIAWWHSPSPPRLREAPCVSPPAPLLPSPAPSPAFLGCRSNPAPRRDLRS